MKTLKKGDRVRYMNRNARIIDIWHDGMELRAEIEMLKGKDRWGVTLRTLRG